MGNYFQLNFSVMEVGREVNVCFEKVPNFAMKSNVWMMMGKMPFCDVRLMKGEINVPLNDEFYTGWDDVENRITGS